MMTESNLQAPTAATLTLETAVALATQHYENFPIASYFLPRKIRKVVTLIYAFARTADDIADEGDLSDLTRLTLLEQFNVYLRQLQKGESVTQPFFQELGQAITEYGLSYAPFFHLITAFKQDVQIKRYPTFKAVLRYCHYSANPVGTLLLELTKQATPLNLRYSHALCTSLQLINFLQDIRSDYCERDRIYLPQRDFCVYQVPEIALHSPVHKENLERLLLVQCKRAENLLRKSMPLCKNVSGGLKWQLSFTIQAALAVLKKLQKRTDPLFCPRLAWYDWLIISLKASCVSL
jgi:squalene synthase HpnC